MQTIFTKKIFFKIHLDFFIINIRNHYFFQQSMHFFYDSDFKKEGKTTSQNDGCVQSTSLLAVSALVVKKGAVKSFSYRFFRSAFFIGLETNVYAVCMYGLAKMHIYFQRIAKEAKWNMKLHLNFDITVIIKSERNKIWTASNCEFNANLLTFLGLCHLLFALDTIGVS